MAREQALQTKVLMAGYERSDSNVACHKSVDWHKCGKLGHKAKKCSEVKANPANISVDKKDGENRNKRDKKKAKEKCPLCKERLTYVKLKDKEEWPPDRLFKCEQFKDLNVRDIAATLERLNCCPMCTSWNHKKDNCKSPARCGIFVSGHKFNGDHSSLVYGSENAYYGSLRGFVVSSDSSCSSSCYAASTASSNMPSLCPSSSSSDSEPESTSDLTGLDDVPPDIRANTLLLFQDVKVKGASEPAYVCWEEV